MTVEEIEIIVTAKVEEALKEFQKILPAIKESMKQAQEAFSKVDTKTMQNKLHQAVQFMKKKMQDFKKSTENNEIAIKVNNKDAQKQISQVQKQIDSLQEKINARQMKLNIINPQIDKMVEDTRKQVTPKGIDPNSKVMDATVNNALSSNKDFTSLNSQAQKLYTEIEAYNTQLNQAKNKMTELGQETSKTATTQSKLGSFFSTFKAKIEQVKPSISNMNKSFKSMPKLTQNITNNIKNMGTGLKQGIGHVMKYAMALFSLRGIYSVLSNSAQSWLSSQNSQAQQLSANIEYMKYAMGSAFAPVVEYVINLVYQLMKAIQSLTYAFSGVNIFAKATASSMKNTAGSAKQTSKSLSSVHSEISNVSDNGNSGGSESATPNMDLSQMDGQMSAFSQKLYDFFKPLKDSWDKYGNNIIEAGKNAIGGIIASVGAMWSSVESIITNGTIYSIISNILNTIGSIGQAWANAWNNDNNGTELIQGIADMINNITTAVLNLVSSTGFQSFLDGIVSAFSGLVQFLEPVISGFSKMAEKILEIVMSTIGDLLKKVGDTLQFIGQNQTAVEILKAVGEAIAIVVGCVIAWNIAQLILNGLMGLFAILTSPITLIILGIVAAIAAIILIIKNWGAISEWFGNLWTNIGNIIKNIWNSIKEFFTNIWNGIKNTAVNVFNSIKDTIVTIITNIKNGISNILNNIKTTWNNIWTTIGNVVKNIWNGIWNCIRGVINAILGGIEGFVNGVIRGINFLLGGISNVANAVGSLIGLSPINLRINTISLPRLAKGGVLTEATTVLAGEYSGAKSNPEIVTPQNIMEETFDRVISRHEGSNGQPMHVTIQYLGKTIFDDTIDYINSKTRRTGKDTIVTVGG